MRQSGGTHTYTQTLGGKRPAVGGAGARLRVAAPARREHGLHNQVRAEAGPDGARDRAVSRQRDAQRHARPAARGVQQRVLAHARGACARRGGGCKTPAAAAGAPAARSLRRGGRPDALHRRGACMSEPSSPLQRGGCPGQPRVHPACGPATWEHPHALAACCQLPRRGASRTEARTTGRAALRRARGGAGAAKHAQGGERTGARRTGGAVRMAAGVPAQQRDHQRRPRMRPAPTAQRGRVGVEPRARIRLRAEGAGRRAQLRLPPARPVGRDPASCASQRVAGPAGRAAARRGRAPALGRRAQGSALGGGGPTEEGEGRAWAAATPRSASWAAATAASRASTRCTSASMAVRRGAGAWCAFCSAAPPAARAAVPAAPPPPPLAVAGACGGAWQAAPPPSAAPAPQPPPASAAPKCSAVPCIPGAAQASRVPPTRRHCWQLHACSATGACFLARRALPGISPAHKARTALACRLFVA
jgi:hypothetical protein